MERDIIVNLKLNREGFDSELQKAAQEAQGTDFSKSVEKANKALTEQVLLYARIRSENDKLESSLKQLDKVRGSDAEKKVNEQIKKSQKEIQELTKAYSSLESTSKKSLSTITKETQKAEKSGVSFARVLESGLGNAVGDGITSVLSGIQAVTGAIVDYAAEGLNLAIANEKVSEGFESTAEKLDKFNDSNDRLKETIGNALLPSFRSFLDLTNDLGEGFLDLIGQGTALSDQTIRQQAEFNTLVSSLESLNSQINDTTTSEGELAILQKQRVGIIGQINSGYGDYIPNLLTEESTLRDIAAATAAANEAFIKRIQLLAKQEQFEELTSQAVEFQREILETNKIIDQLQTKLENEGDLGVFDEAQLRVNREQVEKLNKSLSDVREQAQAIGDQGINIKIDPSESKILGTVGEQVLQLQTSLGILKAERLEIPVGNTEQIKALDANIKLIESRIKALNGDESKIKVKVDKQSEELLKGTVAFLRNQISELQKELDFKIGIDQKATRERILNQIKDLNAQIKQANEITVIEPLVLLDDSKIREDFAELEVDLPVKAVVKEVEVDDTVPTTEGLIDLDQLDTDLQKALAVTSVATDSIGGLFDTLAENRLAKENITEEEIAKIRKNQFNREKAFAVVQSAIQGALLTLKLGSTLGLPGYILGAGFAAIQAAAIIAAQKPGFKDGVFDLGNSDSKLKIAGKGSERSDSIPAWLSRGESVISAQRTRENYDILKMIDKGHKISPYTSPDGTPYFAPKPLSTIPQPSRLRSGVKVAARESIDYKKLGNTVASELAKFISSKGVGKANEETLFNVLSYMERKGFTTADGDKNTQDILNKILSELKK